MKRLLALFLVLCLCFSLVACSGNKKITQTPESVPTQTEDPAVQGTATPLLYKVTDEAGHVAYLFGSIHVGQEYFYPLPSYVTEAFEGADVLAVEVDIVAFEKSLSAQIIAMKPLIYTDGTRIDDHLPEELYEEAVQFLQIAGAYADALDYYCPAMWSAYIDSFMYGQVDAPAELGIDRYLLKMAKEQDKPIQEVESAEFQYTMLANFSEELQILLLENSLENARDVEGLKADIQETMDLWASGDEEAFVATLYEETEVREEDVPLYEEYEKAMVTDRNISMADYAEEALASGETVFICVGAAHVIGPGAMAELLSQRGYEVKLIQ